MVVKGRSRKMFLRLVAAGLSVVVVLGLFAASYILIPGVRSYVKSQPVMQEAGLFLYRLIKPAVFEARDSTPRAMEIVLLSPMGVAEDRDGNLFVGDRGKWFGLAAIWKIGADGTARLVAGSGHRGPVETGIDALRSDLGSPEGLSIDEAGRPYFADSVNHVVLRLESDGRLTRIAGSGAPGFSGDGGAATEAALRRPFDVRFDSQGRLYIADFGNNRVRRVAADGTIETVAGSGGPGYSGDGGPATAARLNGPYGIFIDHDDSLLIADSFNHVIRRVDHDGIITTVFGSGERGYSGDGGPASAASFNLPESLHVDRSGRIYVGDEHSHAIRSIAPDGTITTMIGTGKAGFSKNGTRATEAQLDDPEYMFSRDDGSMVISEGDNGRVLIVKPDGRLETLAGRR